MKEENSLLKKVGTKNPFQIPDRYFKEFTEELMNKLPEKEFFTIDTHITLWQRVKPWIYMVAMFCGIMLSVKIFVGNPEKNDFPVITQTDIENLTEQDWEHIVKHSMIDGYELYELLLN